MPLFMPGEIIGRLVRMAETSFFGQAAPPSSPGEAAPTTSGAEDEEAEPSIATTHTKYRVPQETNRRRTYEEEEKNRTHENSLIQYGRKHQHSVCLSKSTPCHVNLTQSEIFDKPLPFTDSQTTHRVGHDSSGSNSCMSEPPPSGTSFPLHQELGSNYTGPLGSQLCKRIYNKPTEQASPTCSPQGAPLLKRGHSEPYQGGSEYGRQECNIKSLQKTGRFPIPTLHGSEKKMGAKGPSPT